MRAVYYCTKRATYGDGKLPIRRGEWIALALILLAAALRMGAPGITEFKRDEANIAGRARPGARA